MERFKGMRQTRNYRQWVQTIVFKRFGFKREQRNGNVAEGDVESRWSLSLLFPPSSLLMEERGTIAGVKALNRGEVIRDIMFNHRREYRMYDYR